MGTRGKHVCSPITTRNHETARGSRRAREILMLERTRKIVKFLSSFLSSITIVYEVNVSIQEQNMCNPIPLPNKIMKKEKVRLRAGEWFDVANPLPKPRYHQKDREC